MASPVDSKGQPNVLPQSHPINLTPAPPVYGLQGLGSDGELHLGGDRRRPTKLRKLLRGLLFLTVFLIVGRLVYKVASRCFKDEDDFDLHNTDWHYDIPKDLPLGTCIQGDQWQDEPDRAGDFWHYASTTFDVPLSADNILLISRGWLSGGTVEILTSDDQPKDKVSINVVAEYHRQGVRKLVKACSVSRDGNQKGVGIFTPVWHHGRRPHRHEDSILFITTIVLPEGVTVKGLETDVPNSLHTLRHLRSQVHFDNLHLKGSNSAIYVDSVSATKGSIRTSNGGIRGSFSSSTSLVLKTSNAPIEAEVALTSDSTDPVLEATTSNGKLDARLILASSSKTGGKFDITTKTSNSPLFVEFKDAPLESTVLLDAKTSNSPAHVSLHPTYEGDYDIRTSAWFKAQVNFLPSDDPSGKHRRRATVSQGDIKSTHQNGTTYWAEEGKPIPHSGKVHVQTSNSGLVLDIAGV